MSENVSIIDIIREQHDYCWNVLYPELPAPLQRRCNGYTTDLLVRENRLQEHYQMVTSYQQIRGPEQLPPRAFVSVIRAIEQTLDISGHYSYLRAIYDVNGVGKVHHDVIVHTFLMLTQTKTSFRDVIRDDPKYVHMLLTMKRKERRTTSFPEPLFQRLREWWLFAP